MCSPQKLKVQEFHHFSKEGGVIVDPIIARWLTQDKMLSEMVGKWT